MDIKFEIEKDFGVIDAERNREPIAVRNISWSGRPPRVDIRRWANDRPLKGISLTEEEAKALGKLLTEAFPPD